MRPARPELVAAVSGATLRGLGALLAELDQAPRLTLSTEDAELAEAARVDLLRHTTRLSQALAGAHLPPPRPSGSGSLRRRVGSAAKRSVLERIQPTRHSASERFVDALSRVPDTLTSLPGRLLLRQHGLVGPAPCGQLPLPALGRPGPRDPAALLARLRAAGLAPQGESPVQAIAQAAGQLWVQGLAAALVVGRHARKLEQTPPHLADAESFGRWVHVGLKRGGLAHVTGQDPAQLQTQVMAQVQAWEGGADPLADHPLGPALRAAIPQMDLQLALVGPVLGRARAILGDPTLGPCQLPLGLEAGPHLPASAHLPHLERRLLQQLLATVLVALPRVPMGPPDAAIWSLRAPDPWLAPGHWAQMG